MLSSPDFEKKQIIFAFLNQGEKLSFNNDNIIIKDKNDKLKHQSTCYRLFALFIVGDTSITTGLLQRSKKFGFSIIFLTYNLKVYGSWIYNTEGNVLLRKKQYDYEGLEIARSIIYNKINNQIGALNTIRNKKIELKNCINKLKEYKKQVLNDNLDLNSILGLEGVSARIYFESIFEECNWASRKPRVKNDIINCLLDIGYTLLFNIIDALLSVYGFDVYKGVLHKQFYQRKSLVCDLVEPFRPIIDLRIRKAYKLKQINSDDFYKNQNQYFLYGKNAVPYVTFLLDTIIENKLSIFNYVQTYYRAFINDKDISNYPCFNIGD